MNEKVHHETTQSDSHYQLKWTHEKSYEDGFADGYSRAWQECWEYMRELAQQDLNKEEMK